jgi:NAD(P)-dependent dehydrogenase (short-subunit alcohol dehydrogenase family)
MKLEEFDRVNSVNYRGAWLCSRAQIRVMEKQGFLDGNGERVRGQKGSVVHIASQLGIVGRPAAREFPFLRNMKYFPEEGQRHTQHPKQL